jgi:F0F1-type ATP synthase assembly protein I
VTPTPSHARHTYFHRDPVPNRCCDVRLSFRVALTAVKREAQEDMTDQDRARLQVAAVIGAVLGGATGYLITHQAGTGGWPKIVIWALNGAVVVSGMVYCLRAFRS